MWPFFWGGDRVESGAVDDKEHGFQVGKGIMEGRGYGVQGGPVGPVDILQRVQGVRCAPLNVGQHQFLKALHDDWS